MTFRSINASLLVISLALLNINSGCPRILDLEADERLVEVARQMPKEDILKDREVAKKVAKTKLYVSLTSSPSRLKHLELVLRTVDLSFVENILIVLPESFRGEAYDIPDHVLNFPKVKIIRIKSDRGPISKLLGSFELDNIYEGREIAEKVLNSPDNFVITIDDDTGYPNGTISQLLKAAIQNQGVVAASANDISFWGMDRNLGWPDLQIFRPDCDSQDLSRCDVIEGFGGVIYRVGDVLEAMDDMLKLSKTNKACFTSDDLVISFALAENNISRFKLRNNFIRIPLQYSYGFQEDALHRGAGLDAEASAKNLNSSKYSQCYETAAQLFNMPE